MRDIINVQTKGTNLKQSITWVTNSSDREVYLETILTRKPGERTVNSALHVNGRTDPKCVTGTRINHKTNTLRVLVKRSCFGKSTVLKDVFVVAGIATGTKKNPSPETLAAFDLTDVVRTVPLY